MSAMMAHLRKPSSKLLVCVVGELQLITMLECQFISSAHDCLNFIHIFIYFLSYSVPNN